MARRSSYLCVVYPTATLPSFLSWTGNRIVRLSHCQQLPGSWMAAVCGWLSVRPALQNILAYLDILSAEKATVTLKDETVKNTDRLRDNY